MRLRSLYDLPNEAKGTSSLLGVIFTGRGRADMAEAALSAPLPIRRNAAVPEEPGWA
jgi:hypothetical protein